MARRVVVTGLGTLNACGNDVKTSWEAVVAGRSGVGKITRFDPAILDMPCHIAAELKNFDPEQWFQRRELKKLDLMTQYGIAAAHQAWEQSGLHEGNGFDPERAGAILGTGIGGLDSIEQTHTTIMEKGPQRVSPFFVPRMMANAIAGNLSIRFNLQGPNFITASACASSNHAITLAYRSIRDDECDVCFTGGAEATITSMGMAGFNSMRAMSTRNDDPERASRPFDKLRDGFVMGEGAGVLLFEEAEHAKKRGAVILAEVLGGGMSADAHHITAPAPGGRGPARAMKLCSAGREAQHRGRLVHQRARDIDDAQRRGRDAGDQDRLRRAGRECPDLFLEVDGRASPRGCRWSRGHLLCDVDPGPGGPPDGQPGRAATPSAISTTCRMRRARFRSATRSPTVSALAVTT